MSGWDRGTRCLVFEACAGWTEAVVERCEGIGSEASLWLRVKGSGEVVEQATPLEPLRPLQARPERRGIGCCKRGLLPGSVSVPLPHLRPLRWPQ